MTEFEAALEAFQQAPNEQHFAAAMKQAVTSYQCVEIALAHNVRGSEFAARAFEKAKRGNGVGNYLAICRLQEQHGSFWMRLTAFRSFLMKNLSTNLPQEAEVEA